MRARSAVAYAALAAALLAVPLAVGGNAYYTLLAAQVMLFATMVAAWNIIGGMAGQLDLAASAYMAIGGITTALLWMRAGVPPALGIFAGGAAAAALATAVGIPTFKFGVKEVWYALMTASLVVILNNVYRYIMGPFDVYLPRKFGLLYLMPRDYATLYYLILAFMAAVVAANALIQSSKVGYYLRTIREDELVAESIGINTRLYKLLALATYAFLVGAVGYLQIVIYASFSYRLFDTGLALSIAIMGIIGGLGSLPGSVLAAIVFRTLGEYLRSTFGGQYPGLDLLLYGVALIVVGIARPDGLAGIIRSISKRLEGREK